MRRSSSSTTPIACCSRAGARGSRIDGLREGEPLPTDLLTGERGVIPLVVPYEVGGRRERLVYLSREGDLAAYEELRAGFTAAVSHELRTPLARLLTLLETTTLPGEDVPALVEQARAEIDQITELIDEVLFLSRARVGRPRRRARRDPGEARPRWRRSRSSRSALRELASSCESSATTTSSSRSGHGCSGSSRGTSPRTPFGMPAPARRSRSRSQRSADDRRPLGRDDGIGIDEAELPRLFERFYRADRARASRGTGLGLAIVKHIVTQAGGTVEARGARGRGLEVRCELPAPVALHRILTTSSPGVARGPARAGVTLSAWTNARKRAR